MEVKCISFLFIALICVQSQDVEQTSQEVDEEPKCFNIYECCKKIDYDCLEYCEPNFVCTNNGTSKELGIIQSNRKNTEEIVETTEAAENLVESTTFQETVTQKVIAVGVCRKGYRLVANGSCKKVF